MMIYTSVVIIVMASVHLFLERALRGFLVGQLETTLTREARIAGSYLANTDPGSISAGSEDELANRFGKLLDVRATIVDGAGIVLGDSEVRDEDLQDLENHSDRPEIIQAWERGVGKSLRYSQTLAEEMLYVAMVVPGNGQRPESVLRLSMPLRQVGRIQGRINRVIWAGSALGVVLAVLLSYSMSSYISRPIAQITKAARAAAGGAFEVSVDVPERVAGEIKELAVALNRADFY